MNKINSQDRPDFIVALFESRSWVIGLSNLVVLEMDKSKVTTHEKES